MVGLLDNYSMRVAMLSYHTCPHATLGGKDTGGMNVYVRDLTRELGRRGVGVDVFTRSQDEHVPHVLHDLGYGNRIVHVRAGPEVPLARTELVEYLPKFVDEIIQFSQAKGLTYDLIHSHYWLSGLAALDLRDLWSVPIIQMFHTLAVMKNRVARSEQEAESTIRVDAEKRLLREVDRVVAATQAEVAQIQWLYQIGTENVAVIPPGVDTSHFYPIANDEAKEFAGIAQEKRIILYVGRIETLKGIDTLLRAIAQLIEDGVFRNTSFGLLVIGGDANLSAEDTNAEMLRLKEISESLGLGSVVSFLGKCDQDTLKYYYSAADIVVVPSHYESFGLVALEAMACGTPVVASETGGLVFLIRDGETGFHVPAGDVASLADRLARLLQDDVLLARLGSQAAAYAKGYDWAHITDQILDLYGTLLPKTA